MNVLMNQNHSVNLIFAMISMYVRQMFVMKKEILVQIQLFQMDRLEAHVIQECQEFVLKEKNNVQLEH